MIKKCKKCKQKKKIELYYTHLQMADGYLNICKCCVKKRVSLHGKTSKAKARDKAREQTPHRKTWKRKYQRILRARYKGKVRARRKLYKALQGGKIIKEPCVECGDKKSQAHHPDYRKPLEVIWLCLKHHLLKRKK